MFGSFRDINFTELDIRRQYLEQHEYDDEYSQK